MIKRERKYVVDISIRKIFKSIRNYGWILLKINEKVIAYQRYNEIDEQKEIVIIRPKSKDIEISCTNVSALSPVYITGAELEYFIEAGRFCFERPQFK